MWKIYKATKHTLLLTLFMLFLVGCVTDTPDEGFSYIHPGDKLPPFEVKMNNGELVTPDTLLGNTAIVVLFTTKCSDCRMLLPTLQRVYQDNIAGCMVLISREEGAADIAAYWEANGLTMPYSAQNDRRVYNMFATSGVPRVYVVDSAGTVVKEWDDDPLPDYEEIKAAL